MEPKASKRTFWDLRNWVRRREEWERSSATESREPPESLSWLQAPPRAERARMMSWRRARVGEGAMRRVKQVTTSEMTCMWTAMAAMEPTVRTEEEACMWRTWRRAM